MYKYILTIHYTTVINEFGFSKVSTWRSDILNQNPLQPLYGAKEHKKFNLEKERVNRQIDSQNC